VLTGPEDGVDGSPRLNVDVIFTSIDATLAALKKAAALASRLGARITLLVPQVVPYPLPLESPPVLLEWNERRFRVIAEECPVETTVHIYLCRDRFETFAAVLKPESLVVVGGRKLWWPTSESRLARALRRAGHEVLFAEAEKDMLLIGMIVLGLVAFLAMFAFIDHCDWV
jgi:hypothetical protein